MRNRTLRMTFAKLLGALALLIASVALLSPCFEVDAWHGPRQNQTQQNPSQSEGVQAPSQRIDPDIISVVNFRKLAEAEARAKKRGALAVEKNEQRVIHAPLSAPDREDTSAPQAPEAAPKTTANTAAGETGGPLIPSPNPAQNFQAIDDTGNNIPPDTMGAVGPDKIFVNVNGRYRVLDKATGTTISTVTISNFWTATGASGVFDPRVVYDPYNNRWIVAAASSGQSANSSILVGVSATSDPGGTYTLFKYTVGCAAGAQGCNTNGEWADFPMLGFNKNWVAVGWNDFAITGGANVAGKMIAIDYPSMRAGTNNSMIFTVTAGSSQNFCMHPAETYSSTEETLYVPVHFSSSSARYQLHKITGTPASPTLTTETVTHTRTGGGWLTFSGDILPQTCIGTPGTDCPTTIGKLDGGDVFLRSNAVFRNGSVWYSQTVGLPAPSPASQTTLTHTGVQWTQIATDGTFLDGARLDVPTATDSNGGDWYAYPSISVNAHNDVLLGFSTFASNHFVRAAYALKAGSDAAGTMRDLVVYKDGVDYYDKTFSGSRNRWGDYSHSVVDPANDLDMWTVQEYAEARTVKSSNTVDSNSRWGTWWARISDIGSPPPSPTPTPSPIPSPTAPLNDNFANAQQINGCTGTLNATNANATKEAGEPVDDPANSTAGGASIWYSWQAPTSDSVTITTIGSDFDTMLGVYTGTSVNALTTIAKNDDIVLGTNIQSSVTFTATAGTVYKISVDGYDADTGNVVLNWTESNCSTNVQFSSANFSVNEGGGSATVSVTRTGNTAGTSTVDYKTTDTDNFTVNCATKQGQAFARCDFATVVATLNFAGGETSKNFSVPIINDGWAEGPETFGVVLSNPSGATLGAQSTATVTITDNETTDQPNPILQTNTTGVDFFVRQHYLDFLGREPEQGQPWSAVLNGCANQFNTDPNSLSAGCDRIAVSGSFFGSPEFKTKGFYVIDMYRVAFNRLPTYVEFSNDLASVTGATAQETFAKRAAYANSFVQRSDFTPIYGAMTNTQYVNALMSGSQGQGYNLTSITTPDPNNPDGPNKVTLTAADLITRLNVGALSRAQVLRAIAQSDQISLQREAVNAFVASQYYGYLRRTPDQAGFNSWVLYLTTNPSDFRTMINGFLNSNEYRLRFGPAQ